MNLNEAKTLVELLLPTIKQVTQAGMDNVSHAMADALKESRDKTDRQIAEVIKRLEALENGG
jgi:polyhydroxyalkanoate synthesis regulator phasin